MIPACIRCYNVQGWRAGLSDLKTNPHPTEMIRQEAQIANGNFSATVEQCPGKIYYVIEWLGRYSGYSCIFPNPSISNSSSRPPLPPSPGRISRSALSRVALVTPTLLAISTISSRQSFHSLEKSLWPWPEKARLHPASMREVHSFDRCDRSSQPSQRKEMLWASRIQAAWKMWQKKCSGMSS